MLNSIEYILQHCLRLVNSEFILNTNEYNNCAKMYSMEFKDFLLDEMNKRGWNNSDLARAANVSRGAIANILREERQPGPELLTAIAAAFKMPPENLFRIAGLLPQKPDSDRFTNEMIEIYSLLEAEDRNELLEYARHRLALAEKRKRYIVPR